MTLTFAPRHIAFLLAFSLSLSVSAVWAFALLAGIDAPRWMYVLVSTLVTGLVFLPIAVGTILKYRQQV